MSPIDISEMDFKELISHEWLAVNGRGGYACSTVCGLNTRKYHGLLVAAMSPPVRRMVLLSHVDEILQTPNGTYQLSSNEYPGTVSPRGYQFLRAFSGSPFPRWAFQADGFTIEKSLRILPGENTVCISYTLLAGGSAVDLELRPLLAMRPIHELMYQWNGRLVVKNDRQGGVQIPATARTPEVFFAHDGKFGGEPYWYLNAIYRREEERGYAGLEDLWNPGTFRWTLAPGRPVHLVCSADPVELDIVRSDLSRLDIDACQRHTAPAGAAHDENFVTLASAAAAFVVTGSQENQPSAPVHVIAQYPWSAPSGRSAMIGFSGLFLMSGLFEQGRVLLQSHASRLQDGLIPTEYPESGDAPTYRGADTSLWFINAVGEYLAAVDNEQAAQSLFPAIQTIIDAYRRGTKLGISTDADGLVASRAPGVATSWMDASIGEWIITPRQGRTVELNALWFNALCIGAKLAARFGKAALAEELSDLARRVQAAFNRRFWNAKLACCFDVVDDAGVDASIRPNQLLAMSLPNPVLAAEYHEPMLQTVLCELLTPFGLRTLSPRDASYQGRYTGGVVSRDRAQHQGSVFPWLLGPLVTAYMRINGRADQTIARAFEWLQPCLSYLQHDGLGQLCELCDGDAPHAPGGAIASALSVAEIFRCYTQDILGIQPGTPGPAGVFIKPPAMLHR